MTLILFFIFILLISFVVIFLLTKPSEQERRLNARLSELTRATTVQGHDDSILIADTLTGFRTLDAIVYRLDFVKDLRKLIAQSGLNWQVGPLVLGSILVAMIVAAILRMFIPSIVLITIISAVVVSLPYLYVYLQRANRFRRFQQYLPEAVDLMARAMRAGHPLASAIEMIAIEVPDPVGGEFRKVFEQQSLGLPIREALTGLVERVPIQDLQFLVTAMLVQKETGGNLVEILEKTSSVLRDRVRLQGQLRIYTAQGRLTGWILCLLPFVMFLLLSLLNPGYTEILLKDEVGQKMTIAGLCFMALGVWVIRKIVDIKV